MECTRKRSCQCHLRVLVLNVPFLLCFCELTQQNGTISSFQYKLVCIQFLLHMYRFLKSQKLVIRSGALQISWPRIQNWFISGMVWLISQLSFGLEKQNYCYIIPQQMVKCFSVISWSHRPILHTKTGLLRTGKTNVGVVVVGVGFLLWLLRGLINREISLLADMTKTIKGSVFDIIIISHFYLSSASSLILFKTHLLHPIPHSSLLIHFLLYSFCKYLFSTY